MLLRHYLNVENETDASFARRVGVTPGAVKRWCDYGRVPDKNNMARVVKATGGLVGPEDFYPLARKLLERFRKLWRRGKEAQLRP